VRRSANFLANKIFTPRAVRSGVIPHQHAPAITLCPQLEVEYSISCEAPKQTSRSAQDMVNPAIYSALITSSYNFHQLIRPVMQKHRWHEDKRCDVIISAVV